MNWVDSKPSKNFIDEGVYLLGFPFDGTASYRKGAKLGPREIRENSDGIESYSPYLHRDTTELVGFFDMGELSVGNSGDVEQSWNHANEDFQEKVSKFEKTKHRLITIGGDHSISYAPIKFHLEQYEDLVLLHLDAHADLRDGYQGYHFSHASIIRRSLDHFKAGHQLIQYGIRSGTKDEFVEMKKRESRCESLKELIEKLESIDSNRPIYLTFDLDFFDPGYFPGTGTPEPGGEDFHAFVRINKVLAKKNLIGADVVELAPELDSSGVSTVLACKVIRELALAMGRCHE